MYNLFCFTSALARNPYVRIEPDFSGYISVEKQVEWALECAEKRIDDADNASCKGFARIYIGSAAESLVKADSVENTPEHTERIRDLDYKLQKVCEKWHIETA